MNLTSTPAVHVAAGRLDLLSKFRGVISGRGLAPREQKQSDPAVRAATHFTTAKVHRDVWRTRRANI